jgi:uncharacterized coiled-coil DUF342 family protein
MTHEERKNMKRDIRDLQRQLNQARKDLENAKKKEKRPSRSPNSESAYYEERVRTLEGQIKQAIASMGPDDELTDD